jgi:hypothetical protein
LKLDLNVNCSSELQIEEEVEKSTAKSISSLKLFDKIKNVFQMRMELSPIYNILLSSICKRENLINDLDVDNIDLDLENNFNYGKDSAHKKNNNTSKIATCKLTSFTRKLESINNIEELKLDQLTSSTQQIHILNINMNNLASIFACKPQLQSNS